ncbi:hypothetical protein [Hymenobacter koreensis]|uniref:hypothetical protein n=1 Tax=Hymenobacter koreensis TaxID=1084523 RepID=UPI0031EA70DF
MTLISAYLAEWRNLYVGNLPGLVAVQQEKLACGPCFGTPPMGGFIPLFSTPSDNEVSGSIRFPFFAAALAYGLLVADYQRLQPGTAR